MHRRAEQRDNPEAWQEKIPPFLRFPRPTPCHGRPDTVVLFFAMGGRHMRFVTVNAGWPRPKQAVRVSAMRADPRQLNLREIGTQPHLLQITIATRIHCKSAFLVFSRGRARGIFVSRPSPRYGRAHEQEGNSRKNLLQKRSPIRRRETRSRGRRKGHCDEGAFIKHKPRHPPIGGHRAVFVSAAGSRSCGAERPIAVLEMRRNTAD